MSFPKSCWFLPKSELFCGECLEDEYFRREDIKALYRAMETLSPTQRRRIMMYMDNISIREIARREGCYMNSVLESVNSALKTLRILLTE